jgi:hypothetical protein
MTKSILIYLSIIAACTLTSCRVTLFDALPGTTQKEFPEQLRGTYSLTMPKQLFKKRSETDTLYATIQANAFYLRDSSKTEETKLDSEHHLQLLNNKHYVMAMKNNDYHKYWELTFIEPSSKGVKLYTVFDNDSTELQKYFSRKFVEISNAGDSVFVYRTNDSSLVTYFEKSLRRKEALELVRIKK